MKKAILSILLLYQFCAHAQNWITLDGAPNHYLNCFYDDSISGKFYVAGTYSLLGNEDYRGIATWDGTMWDSLGAGVDDIGSTYPQNTHAVIRYDSSIIIGGAFTNAGDIYTPFLAQWNGVHWDPMFGGQPNNVVNDLQIFNGELYACGSFDSIGASSAHCIAKWDGTSWITIGNNYDFNGTLSGRLWRMIWYNGNLYVCGSFRDQWGNLCRLAKWNGVNWQFMVSDVQGSLAQVNDMIVYDDELYIGGLFFANDGNRATGIMKWNDTIWTDVGGSLMILNDAYPSIKDMCVHNGKLYCAGNFERIGGIDVSGVASWDGIDWCGYNALFELAPGQNIGTSCVGFFNDTMYVGGGFWFADGDSVPFLAKWNGGSFVDTCGNTTSVTEQEASNRVSVYPNPVSDEIRLEFATTGNRLVIIYDYTGKEIWREENTGAIVKVDVRSFADGLYFFNATMAGEEAMQGKFLIMH